MKFFLGLSVVTNLMLAGLLWMKIGVEDSLVNFWKTWDTQRVADIDLIKAFVTEKPSKTVVMKLIADRRTADEWFEKEGIISTGALEFAFDADDVLEEIKVREYTEK